MWRRRLNEALSQQALFSETYDAISAAQADSEMRVRRQKLDEKDRHTFFPWSQLNEPFDLGQPSTTTRSKVRFNMETSTIISSSTNSGRTRQSGLTFLSSASDSNISWQD